MDFKQVIAANNFLFEKIIETPLLDLSSSKVLPLFPSQTRVKMKLEFLQHVGSFKARGVLLGLSRLTVEQKKAGVIAFSAGNHALAVSWAAQFLGISAKVIMPKTADKFRVEGCKTYAAEILLAEDAEEGFSLMYDLSEKEKRQVMHPFEADHMIIGAATCGLEMISSMPDMDVAIIPIGGGGLISGISSAIKLVKPSVTVFGVEPYGADSMFQSFLKKKPMVIDKVKTIADSLGAPMALPKSFELARRNVDEIVRLTDNEMVESMNIIREKLNFLVEPACGSSLAACLGPLKEKVLGKNVALIACGSNISFDRYKEIVS
ncbi:MAG: pyridoxal-phosphate dependent enzyme [Paracoccaceae bacterium]|nr:pyridoxal-phosphate dependent enzyme [Paracoccaceae bacterium]